MKSNLNYSTSNRHNKIIAVVFDDHRMFAESMAALLERADVFDSVYTFSQEKELISFLHKNESQYETFFFVDYYLGDKHCIPIVNEAKRMNKRLRTIIVSSVMNTAIIKYIDSNNPEGFLSKIAGFDEVLTCVRTLQEGRRYTSPILDKVLQNQPEHDSIHFSKREIELLQYFYQGLSIASTAERVSLSMHTIVSHRRRMMEKAKCKSMAELLVFCRKNGLVADSEVSGNISNP
jgi:DNA-binding NarL/FixJ family response regulator